MLKQIINYFVTILLWVISLFLLMTGIFPYLFGLLAAAHLAELIFVGWRTGKEAQIPGKTSFLMCMVFGNYWWRPIRRRIKEEEYTDEDFLEQQ